MGGDGRGRVGKDRDGRGGEGIREGKEGDGGWEGRGAPPLLILQFNHCADLLKLRQIMSKIERELDK